MLVRSAFYFDHFVIDVGFFPFAVHAILVGVCRIESFDVQIQNVGAIISESPGDSVVVSYDDQSVRREARIL